MSIRKYKETSIVDKERLIKAYDLNQDWVQLTEQMGINIHTAKSIISKWRKRKELQNSHQSSSLYASGGQRGIIIYIHVHVVLTTYIQI